MSIVSTLATALNEGWIFYRWGGEIYNNREFTVRLDRLPIMCVRKGKDAPLYSRIYGYKSHRDNRILYGIDKLWRITSAVKHGVLLPEWKLNPEDQAVPAGFTWALYENRFDKIDLDNKQYLSDLAQGIEEKSIPFSQQVYVPDFRLYSTTPVLSLRDTDENRFLVNKRKWPETTEETLRYLEELPEDEKKIKGWTYRRVYGKGVLSVSIYDFLGTWFCTKIDTAGIMLPHVHILLTGERENGNSLNVGLGSKKLSGSKPSFSFSGDRWSQERKSSYGSKRSGYTGPFNQMAEGSERSSSGGVYRNPSGSLRKESYGQRFVRG